MVTSAGKPHYPMQMYCIYENPKDFPGKFAVREWLVADAVVNAVVKVHAVVATLEEARATIPTGLIRSPRTDGDDACIVETWL
jgi:hypothetical protein